MERSGENQRQSVVSARQPGDAREGYHQLIAAEPERWVCINRVQPVEKAQAETLAALGKRLKGVVETSGSDR